MTCWRCTSGYQETSAVVVADTTLYDGMSHARYQCPACGAMQDAILPSSARPFVGYYPINYTEHALR